MKVTRTIACGEAPGTVRQRLEGYLISRGFQVVPSSTGTLLDGTRGSWLGSLTSFSPKKWGVRLKVAGPENGSYRFDCDINTTGQKVTESEIEFWEAEVDGIATVILSGDAQIGDIDQASTKAAGRAIKLMLGYAILFGGVGFAIDSISLRHGAHTSWAAIGSGIGAATGAGQAAKKSRKGK